MTTFQTLALRRRGRQDHAARLHVPVLDRAAIDFDAHERLTRVRIITVIVAAAGLASCSTRSTSATFSEQGLRTGVGALVGVRLDLHQALSRQAPRGAVAFTAWQMAYGAVPIVIVALFVRAATCTSRRCSRGWPTS